MPELHGFDCYGFVVYLTRKYMIPLIPPPPISWDYISYLVLFIIPMNFKTIFLFLRKNGISILIAIILNL